ncbi:MAG TPA: hypothetical protein VFG29_08305 [Syntrophales bacterium]|nr:hypothetical protein [Syntrophales bacterium]
MSKKKQSYKKIVLFVTLSWTFSFILIALDQHVEGFSSTCPVCQLKISVNGTGHTAVIEIYPTVTYYDQIEYPSGVTIPMSSPFVTRAPPELFHS